MEPKQKPKAKCYTARPRILDMSRRQIGYLSIFSLGMLGLFFILSFQVPPEHRSHFRSSTMPTFIGLSLAFCGTWLYKRWKPDPAQHKGMSAKTYFQQTALGVVLMVAFFVVWRVLYLAGHPNQQIALILGGSGGALLLLSLIIVVYFRRRDAKRNHKASQNLNP